MKWKVKALLAAVIILAIGTYFLTRPPYSCACAVLLKNPDQVWNQRSVKSMPDTNAGSILTVRYTCEHGYYLQVTIDGDTHDFSGEILDGQPGVSTSTEWHLKD